MRIELVSLPCIRTKMDMQKTVKNILQLRIAIEMGEMKKNRKELSATIKIDDHVVQWKIISIGCHRLLCAETDTQCDSEHKSSRAPVIS